MSVDFAPDVCSDSGNTGIISFQSCLEGAVPVPKPSGSPAAWPFCWCLSHTALGEGRMQLPYAQCGYPTLQLQLSWGALPGYLGPRFTQIMGLGRSVGHTASQRGG